jgi:ribonuclease HII
VVKGDSLSISIGAASILAKVYRDGLMKDLARQYPGYGWERNAGYGTALHQQGLAALGVTPYHRRSFKPVQAFLQKVG